VAAETDGLGSALGRVPERIATLVELVTTLDRRLLSALDGLEEMRTTVAGFENVGSAGDELIADLQERVARTDERINRDLDELKAAAMAKIGEVDLADLGPRIDRLESAILNIERATVSLDQAFEGGLEMLPDFLSRRVKKEGKKVAPSPDSAEPLT
jgi:predicted RecB family endonuclease